MFDQLIARKNTQTAAVKKAAPKVATKTAGKGAAKTVRKADAGKAPRSIIKFAVQDFARPNAGAALFAHTSAFLELSGLADGAPVGKVLATKILGARAVQYHQNNGNFAHGADGLTLTEKGEEFFAVRMTKTDPEMMAAYAAFFTDGKQNPAINIKTPGSIVAL